MTVLFFLLSYMWHDPLIRHYRKRHIQGQHHFLSLSLFFFLFVNVLPCLCLLGEPRAEVWHNDRGMMLQRWHGTPQMEKGKWCPVSASRCPTVMFSAFTPQIPYPPKKTKNQRTNNKKKMFVRQTGFFVGVCWQQSVTNFPHQVAGWILAGGASQWGTV